MLTVGLELDETRKEVAGGYYRCHNRFTRQKAVEMEKLKKEKAPQFWKPQNVTTHFTEERTARR